jgi:hypothetical protein
MPERCETAPFGSSVTLTLALVVTVREVIKSSVAIEKDLVTVGDVVGANLQ